MASWFSSLPALRDFFPPTPQAFRLVSLAFSRGFPAFASLNFTRLGSYQSMGKTSTNSLLSFNGRYSWAIAEAIGPLNLLFILYTLPKQLKGIPESTGLFGTGLPIQNELLGLLYVAHYVNRAIMMPLFMAPSMSPIHLAVSFAMASHQIMNSICLGSWLTYSAVITGNQTPVLSITSIIGILLFIGGLAGNIIAETTLFDMRRGAAKRKAKSEGKAVITYNKVYVIPAAEGLFKYVLHPHYSLEWIEWTGYWILGGAWGLGWGYGKSAALWFLVNELVSMSPRALTGLEWYKKRFGVKAVGKRKAVVPGLL